MKSEYGGNGRGQSEAISATTYYIQKVQRYPAVLSQFFPNVSTEIFPGAKLGMKGGARVGEGSGKAAREITEEYSGVNSYAEWFPHSSSMRLQGVRSRRGLFPACFPNVANFLSGLSDPGFATCGEDHCTVSTVSTIYANSNSSCRMLS